MCVRKGTTGSAWTSGIALEEGAQAVWPIPIVRLVVLVNIAHCRIAGALERIADRIQFPGGWRNIWSAVDEPWVVRAAQPAKLGCPSPRTGQASFLARDSRQLPSASGRRHDEVWPRVAGDAPGPASLARTIGTSQV